MKKLMASVDRVMLWTNHIDIKEASIRSNSNNKNMGQPVVA